MTGHTLLMEIDHAFQKTLHAARSMYKEKNFIEYVVCPKCSCLYMITECNDDQTNPRRCSFVEFPHHPHATRRSACTEVLMKRVKIGGKYKLIPRKVYMYQSVIYVH